MIFVISAFPFVSLPTYTSSAHTGRIFVKSDVGDLRKSIWRLRTTVVRVEQKDHQLYIKT
jgi:hypothetical protein